MWNTKKKGRMEIGVMGIMFLVLFSSHFFISYPSALHKALPSVHLQENGFGGNKTGKSKNRERDSTGSTEQQFSHGGVRGGGADGGRSSGNGENGNSGGSSQGAGAGAAAVIPIYAAGAANNHHPSSHRSAASIRGSYLEFPTLAAAILGTLVVYINVVLGFEN